MLRAAICACLMLVACAGPSTTTERTWRPMAAEGIDLHDVVTLYASPDGAIRRSVEDAMAAELNGRGIRAAPAYAVLGDAELRDPERARTKLLASGFDGVIAMRLAGTYVPATFDDVWGRAGAWSEAFAPGDYLLGEDVVRFETSAYRLLDKRHVWSALSTTVDPNSIGDAIDELTTSAANAMQERGVVVAGAQRWPDEA